MVAPKVQSPIQIELEQQIMDLDVLCDKSEKFLAKNSELENRIKDLEVQQREKDIAPSAPRQSPISSPPNKFPIIQTPVRKRFCEIIRECARAAEKEKAIAHENLKKSEQRALQQSYKADT